MRPQLFTISKEPGHSFSVRRDLVPYINDCWHFHTEVELVHFEKGQGAQFVGDSLSRFKAGDIVLVGAHLPHNWRFDPTPDPSVDVRVAHFSESFWGSDFLDLPENQPLKTLLERARRGLQISGVTKKKTATLLERLLDAQSMSRLILLLEILQTLANAPAADLQPLASQGFKQQLPEGETERIRRIYEYSHQYFKRPISLEEIAAVARISPHSFCRFFKNRTKKTYSRFLLELRVGHACRLLIENSLSIKQVCYESGFNNFTSFYKYFKLIAGKSPLGYQKEFMGLPSKTNHHETTCLDSYPLLSNSPESPIAYA
ncbi:MAG: helix-turn-helix domain-containing protein [Bacteroidetes bacterium]|nr:helix-turn-helix domain-containing protein [Bacteroidota bacterium]